jgi:hypothetical protein
MAGSNRPCSTPATGWKKPNPGVQARQKTLRWAPNTTSRMNSGRAATARLSAAISNTNAA